MQLGPQKCDAKNAKKMQKNAKKCKLCTFSHRNGSTAWIFPQNHHFPAETPKIQRRAYIRWAHHNFVHRMNHKAPPRTKMWGKLPGTSHLQTPWANFASRSCYNSNNKVKFSIFYCIFLLSGNLAVSNFPTATSPRQTSAHFSQIGPFSTNLWRKITYLTIRHKLAIILCIVFHAF